jgi:hypothetical protein
VTAERKHRAPLLPARERSHDSWSLRDTAPNGRSERSDQQPPEASAIGTSCVACRFESLPVQRRPRSADRCAGRSRSPPLLLTIASVLNTALGGRQEEAPPRPAPARPACVYSRKVAALAIQPKYGTPEPDSRVDLYKGPLSVAWDQVSLLGPGSVYLEWYPFPHVGFEVALEAALDTPETPDEVAISLLESGGTAQAETWRVEQRVSGGDIEPRRLGGGVTGELLVGNPAPVETVLFHVPNFPDYVGGQLQATAEGGSFWKGRLSASTQAWSVDIDAVPHLRELLEAVGKGGGYGITHVGRLQRSDGAPMAFEEVDRVCEELHWWLSLLRSERTGPLLVMGVHQGETVWEIWRTPTVSRWRGRWSWLPRLLRENDGTITPVDGGKTLERLDALWPDPDLRRTVVRAIDWYTQSVASGHVATTIILAQAGLELMTWLRLVVEARMSDDGFSKMTAADALRLTLSFGGVPPDIPAIAPDLHAAARPQPGGLLQLDGPSAITEIRNGVVHPKPRPRFGDLAMHQGGLLAIRLLELLLLHRLGYDGRLLNRLSWGQPEWVPWAH